MSSFFYIPMKKTLLLLCLFLVTINSFGQKKIKIEGENPVVFVLKKDSITIAKKEVKNILHSFYHFFEAVQKDDTLGYKNLLSSNTLKNIRPEKITRKYGKFRGYKVQLFGKLSVGAIQLYPKKTFEDAPVYVCAVHLPPGQTIVQRVGFDPLKKVQFEGKENYVALHLVKTDLGYRIVIPW